MRRSRRCSGPIQGKRMKIQGPKGRVAAVKPAPAPKPPVIEEPSCTSCKQKLNTIRQYTGHPTNAQIEYIVLTHEKLAVSTDTANEEELPTYRLTNFSMYDDEYHLCPLEVIEKDVVAYMSGYVLPFDDESPSPNSGVPACNLGPIVEWFIFGFDGGEHSSLGVMTQHACYILLEPSKEYKPIIEILDRKCTAVSKVIEYLLDHFDEIMPYEDLLTHILSLGIEYLNEEFLIENALFICQQISNFDEAGTKEDKSLMTTFCVKGFMKAANVSYSYGQLIKDTKPEEEELGASKKHTKAVTTDLVRSVFENFFRDEIQEQGDNITPSMEQMCGICKGCLLSYDCGLCENCINSKGKCTARLCTDLTDSGMSLSERGSDESCVNAHSIEVRWLQKPLLVLDDKRYYYSALVDGVQVCLGNFVLIVPNNGERFISKIEYMYEREGEIPMMHIRLFYRGIDTILRETAHPREIYAVDVCKDYPIGSIAKVLQVYGRTFNQSWHNTGALNTTEVADKNAFFYSKQYNVETAKFTDYIDHSNGIHVCSCCKKKQKIKELLTATFRDGCIHYARVKYSENDYVFLQPDVYQVKTSNCDSPSSRVGVVPKVDETIFTEIHRKTNDIQGSNCDTPEPFWVARLERISIQDENIIIEARIFYRPENTRGGIFLSHTKDLNLLYWTEKVITTSFENVVTRCYVRFCEKSGRNDLEWYKKGPYRFYYSEAYDPATGEFQEVPLNGRIAGFSAKDNGKVDVESSGRPLSVVSAPSWPKFNRPLRCMDVFSGCGGLSLGLHQSGVAKTFWAIEKDRMAAHAYAQNFPTTTVFTGDCNTWLEAEIRGEHRKNFPKKGEVDILIGGPPCQGFSGMNQFNSRQYSQFKNSLVVTYLSYCDYYRPKYFILENVRNFSTFKRSMVLKLTLRCLLEMGYQVGFGVLQAGHYGVPQARRRFILIAAAPGNSLPKLPEPQYVFNRKSCHLSLVVDNIRYTNGNLWNNSAPYRTICIRDAISDLPIIDVGAGVMPYGCAAVSHFQRKMREGCFNDYIVDHVCKQFSPLVRARIANIPHRPGADWRDLPNVSLKLCDGTMTNKLKYPYRLKKQRTGEPNRGVCHCALGKYCLPLDRQHNTLIPWCLPHTADRHNNWTGLYGRLEWDGAFGTTVTNPEPMSKQGRVLHPDQDRVISIRESARSQGFPDCFQFFGCILDRYKQIGNAVPPPLSEAIGFEIMRAIIYDGRHDRF